MGIHNASDANWRTSSEHDTIMFGAMKGTTDNGTWPSEWLNVFLLDCSAISINCVRGQAYAIWRHHSQFRLPTWSQKMSKSGQNKQVFARIVWKGQHLTIFRCNLGPSGMYKSILNKLKIFTVAHVMREGTTNPTNKILAAVVRFCSKSSTLKTAISCC